MLNYRMYHSMYISELKEEAKKRGIKFYYIKKRAELIQLLTMKELPEINIVEKKTIKVLREEAKDKGIDKPYSYKREHLVRLLYPHLYTTEEHHKDYDGTQKHDNPKESNTQQVRINVMKDFIKDWS